ncbi:MAG: FliA/WhiG family RNA polymerase sigma factor [Actinomycetota bacterium]
MNGVSQAGVIEKREQATKEEAEIVKVWQEYKSMDSIEARDKLILHYAPLVKCVAGRLSVGASPNVEQVDLVSCGVFGLIDAIERFDLSKNTKFETYATPRIKGAIIDGLRALDWIPRSIRFKAKELEKAYATLKNKLKRTPTDEEVSQEMGISVKKLQEMLGQIGATTMVALNGTFNVGMDKDNRVSLIDIVEDENSVEPSKMFELEEMRTMLAQAIDTLPEREKTIIILHYYKGLPFKDIREIFEVSEPRISQIHSKAILQLRAKLEQLSDDRETAILSLFEQLKSKERV